MLNSPCSVSSAPLNTGVDCQIKMSAPAMYILLPASCTWQASDEANFLDFIQTKCHAVPNQRWFPIFGNNAPVRTINDSKESDVIVTYDDGSQAFIRNGTIGRTLMTNKGGLAYAKALRSFNNFNGYAFIEIDKYNNVLRKKLANGSYCGVPLNMFEAPTPEQATLKTEFQPAFAINYTADDYISKGEIATSDEDLLGAMGLINSQLVASGTVSTNATAATSTITISNIGANGDSFEIIDPRTMITIMGGSVVKTSSETTVTLLAAKIVAAINNDTLINGGYTATNLAGVITITAPLSMGASINSMQFTTDVNGTITWSNVGFTGGVTNVTGLNIGIRTSGTQIDLIAKYPSLTATTSVVITKLGAVVNYTATIVNGLLQLNIPNATTGDIYQVRGGSPSAWLALSAVGYDASGSVVTFTI